MIMNTETIMKKFCNSSQNSHDEKYRVVDFTRPYV